MKFYGDANLQQNELQNAVLSTLSAFPANPKQGQVAFVNSTVYICVSIANNLPVWVPLTREITAYTHTQSSGATVWNINHKLNTTSVNVQVYDNASQVLIPDTITTVDANNVQIVFNYALAGRAVVVTGHFDGLVKPTYAYTYYQSTAATTWVIAHNLGYNPVVRVFIGNNEVQPASITHDSVNQTTITFSTAQAGYARLQ
jgi:hypothetical protein